MADKKEKKNEIKDEKAVKQNQKPQGHFSKVRSVFKRDKKVHDAKAPQARPLLTRDPYDVLKFVLMTEKAVRQIELQNKLVFIVDRKSKKPEIKAAAQAAFNMPIAGVTTVIDQAGRKKAMIKFDQAGAAGEIAVRLGII